MRTTAVFAFLSLALITGIIDLYSAPATTLTIVPSAVPQVSLLALDSPLVDTRIAELFRQRSAEWSYFRPYALVISNQATQPIRGLTIRWTITDTSGNEKPMYTLDSYYYLNQTGLAVVSKSQTLLTPGAFVPAIPGSNNRGPTIPAPTKGLIDEFSRAAKVAVEIDTVIFADNHIVGPDRSRTVAHMEARELATRTVVRRVRQAANDGEKIETVLQALVALSRVRPPAAEMTESVNATLSLNEAELVNFYASQQAIRIQQAPNPMQSVDRVATIPPLPKFFRE